MKKIIASIFMSGVIFLLGCASSPDDISSAYVSPLQYRDYDCDQIAMEMGRVSRRISEVYGIVKRRRGKDTKNMTVGMVLFWPSLFFIKGDGPEATEFARLKGELEALEISAIQKKCDPSMIPKFPEFEDPAEEKTYSKTQRL